MNLNALVPLKLGYIREPLLVGHSCMEVTVQDVFCQILWIFCVTSTAVVAVLNGGFNFSDLANTQNAFDVYMNVLVMLQVIPDAAVALVWAFHVNGFDLFDKQSILDHS